LAYTGLADAHALSAVPREAMPKAREATLKALSLDDRLAEAHNSLGLILAIYDYDFAGAEREFKRAIELDPNNATAYFYYGNMCSHLRNYGEALAKLKRSLELEPFSLVVNRVYGDRLIS